MTKQKKTMIILTIAFLMIQTLTLIDMAKDIKQDHTFELFIITAFFISYTFIELKYNLHLSNYIRGLIILTLISHMQFGQYLNFYTKFFYFDIILHIFGTYSFTLFTYSLLNKTVSKPSLAKNRELILIVLLGISLGTLFEIIKFLIDIIFTPKIPAQTGLIDTNLDMIANIVGAVIAAVHLANTDLIRESQKHKE
ncbi:hypothetical protein [Acetohalobium arabaticum]|uniref:DUF2238 domain-containing protein n=1 Tax=Acetohalobium arabaticum (strain ATCC 49924 / DSM 5501 / Z-7288) TaxID=574087 RepID=D9QQG2_ACEAZ|nr:hypothetical protein [Acetohalobium arabaticum]ADL12753.1 hypothetical protein Acear_1236 [Acetohalobium arabaticum DSM 5501]